MKKAKEPAHLQSTHFPATGKSPQQMTAAEALNVVFADFKPNTQRAYSRVLRDFQTWAHQRGINDLRQLTSLQLLEYKNHLKAQNKKPASINQTMSALRKVFKVLTEFGYLKDNPFKSTLVRSEKVSDISNKGSIGVNSLNAMIMANESLDYDVRLAPLLRRRNALLVRFLFFTAARRSEAAALQWDDLRQDGQYHVALVRNTKSGVPQRLKLRNELIREMSQWRLFMQSQGIFSHFVFPSLGFRVQGGPMSGKGVNDVVARLGRQVGLSISAHYLRHTAITTALDLGEPLQKVQAYARHSSANTTIRYFHDQEILEKNPTDRLPVI